MASEVLTCPHCLVVYQAETSTLSDDHPFQCTQCGRVFLLIYGRRTDLAASTAAASTGSGGAAVPGFRCVHCQSSLPPVTKSQISTAGWIVFALLLVFFLPLCWIGLLITEKHKYCASCGLKLA